MQPSQFEMAVIKFVAGIFLLTSPTFAEIQGKPNEQMYFL